MFCRSHRFSDDLQRRECLDFSACFMILHDENKQCGEHKEEVAMPPTGVNTQNQSALSTRSLELFRFWLMSSMQKVFHESSWHPERLCRARFT